MRARQGDRDAVATLFEDHWPALWRVVYALTRRRDVASDIAQEAFVRALEQLDRFDDQRPLRPWLGRIAVNLTYDHFRAEQRLVQANSRETADEVLPPDTDTAVAKAVAQLPVDRRVVVVLHYWLGFSTTEIAEILELPLGTVGSRLSRALSQLRMILEAQHA